MNAESPGRLMLSGRMFEEARSTFAATCTASTAECVLSRYVSIICSILRRLGSSEPQRRNHFVELHPSSTVWHFTQSDLLTGTPRNRDLGPFFNMSHIISSVGDMTPPVNFNEQEKQLMQSWVTPARSEILAAKSEIVAALEAAPCSEAQLLDNLAPVTRHQYGPPAFNVNRGQTAIEHLSDTDPYFAEPRLRNAYISALAELTDDGIVSLSPRFEPPLLPPIGGPQVSRTNPIVIAPPGPNGLLVLAHSLRGYGSSDDHKAFDAQEYDNGTRTRLVTTDGRILLREALACHRNGQYLAAHFMVGAFMESVWLEAADLVRSSDQPVQTALNRSPFPLIAEVMARVLDYVSSGQRGRFFRAQLDGPSSQLVAVRNAIGHGTIVASSTGNFTEVSSALIIVSAYRQLELLEQMLVANGL